MIKGLYIASTNMVTNVKKIDVLSNNIANLSSKGFKRNSLESESFNNRLLTRINGSNTPFKGDTPTVKTEVYNGENTVTTDNGYFRVKNAQGFNYSSELKFFKDVDGYLRTIYKNAGGTINPLKGNLVYGQKGPIFLGENDFTVDEKGNIVSGGETLDNLISMGSMNTIGTLSAGVRSYAVLTDFEQGQLEPTNNKYEFALNGEGFFNIQTKHGALMTRDGSFTINNASELVDFNGNQLIGLNGPIVIESEDFSVNENGEIIQNGEITDKIKISNYSNTSDLEKVGGVYFVEKPVLTGERIEFEGEVFQGYLEQSNTDSITEMLRLMELNRNYENSQKVVTTIDEMLGKAVNEVARV